MKRLYGISLAIVLAFGISGCVAQGVNVNGMMGAAQDLGKAVTVSDAELVDLSMKMRQQEEAGQNVAKNNSPHVKRINKLFAKHKTANGRPLNYKVFISNEVNANATADGSIRIYSGLLDLMNDNEVLYVVGHEIGHVVNGDALDAVRMQYASSGLIKTAGAANANVAMFTNSQLGDLLHATLNAQFSQRQETKADEYALAFMKENRYDTRAAASALRKLAKLGGAGGSLLSSHPDSEKRAQHMEELNNAGM